MKSLAVHAQEKKLNLDKFFDQVNVSNKQLIKIKKNIIKLLKELVEDRIIDDEIVLVLKSDEKKTC